MDGTEEAHQLAEQTRALAKRRRESDLATPPPSKKGASKQESKRQHSCTHRIAIPADFDVENIKLDPAVHGEEFLTTDFS